MTTERRWTCEWCEYNNSYGNRSCGNCGARPIGDRRREMGWGRRAIGSQEWRYNKGGAMTLDEKFLLSTRCGLIAPGRSEGQHCRVATTDGFWWLEDRTGVLRGHATRADAAAAAWQQREPYDCWVAYTERRWEQRMAEERITMRVTLPSRRLVHRPREITPIYEEEEK